MPRNHRRSGLFVPILTVIVGLALLSNNLGLFGPAFATWWPVLLIAIGGALLAIRWRRGGRRTVVLAPPKEGV